LACQISFQIVLGPSMTKVLPVGPKEGKYSGPMKLVVSKQRDLVRSDCLLVRNDKDDEATIRKGPLQSFFSLIHA